MELVETIDALEQAVVALRTLLRDTDEHFHISTDRLARFELDLRECRDRGTRLANQIQLWLWEQGIDRRKLDTDRRYLPERRQQPTPRPPDGRRAA